MDSVQNMRHCSITVWQCKVSNNSWNCRNRCKTWNIPV